MAALFVGIIAAFIWSWPMALVGIGVTPVIMIAGAIAAKADMESIGATQAEGSDEKTDEQKES